MGQASELTDIDNAMTRAFITGATGFIGRHLARAAVSHGYDVTCLVRATSATKSLDELNVRQVCGDVTDRESLPGAIRGQDVVFHLAGCVKRFGPAASMRSMSTAPGILPKRARPDAPRPS